VSLQRSFVGNLLPPASETSLGIGDPSVILPPQVTLFEGQSLESMSGAALNYAISRRLSFGVNYQFSRMWTFGRPEGEDLGLLSHTVSSTLRFQVTRHLAVRGGYGFTDSRVGPAGSPHVRAHSADAGIDYGRGGSIRLTNKTSLSF